MMALEELMLGELYLCPEVSIGGAQAHAAPHPVPPNRPGAEVRLSPFCRTRLRSLVTRVMLALLILFVEWAFLAHPMCCHVCAFSTVGRRFGRHNGRPKR
jgi:hypothetical protein